MGFLDKAKKLADQAQAKLDEVQQDFNKGQASGAARASGGAAVEYDQHGRPVSAAPSSPPATAAAPGVPPAPADKSPSIDPSTPTSADPAPAKAEGDPLLNDEPGSRHGQAPPTPPSGGQGLTSGDPLAG
jgi:hypothetical protein